MEREHKEPVVVGEYQSEFEATIIKNMLLGNDIPCELSGSTISGFRAEAPNMVQVIVPAGFEQRAKELLADHENRPKSDDSD